jgi:hypothetical protein
MAHDPKQLQALLARAAPPDLDLAFRPMFGGVMGYAEGKPFASLSDVGLALKASGADHAALLALPGAAPLRYAPAQQVVRPRARGDAGRPRRPAPVDRPQRGRPSRRARRQVRGPASRGSVG